MGQQNSSQLASQVHFQSQKFQLLEFPCHGGWTQWRKITQKWRNSFSKVDLFKNIFTLLNVTLWGAAAELSDYLREIFSVIKSRNKEGKNKDCSCGFKSRSILFSSHAFLSVRNVSLYRSLERSLEEVQHYREIENKLKRKLHRIPTCDLYHSNKDA